MIVALVLLLVILADVLLPAFLGYWAIAAVVALYILGAFLILHQAAGKP